MAEENLNSTEQNQTPFEDFDLTALGEMSELIEKPIPEEKVEEPNKLELGEKELGEKPKDGVIEKSEEKEIQGPSAKDIENSPLLPYAKLLEAGGHLDINDFDGTSESIIKAQEKTLNAWKEDYKNNLNPKVKWLQDNIEEGVPLESLLKIDKERVEYSKITPETIDENTDLQKDLIVDYYKKTTQFSDEKIKKEVDRIENIGDLGTEAKAVFEELKVINQATEAKLQEEAQTARREQLEDQTKALNDFKTSLDSKKEIIPGLDFSKPMKEKVFKTLTTVVAQDESGNPLNKIAQARMQNPQEFEMNLAYVFELTNGFKDWGALNASGKKSAIKEFEQAATKLDHKQSQGHYRAEQASPDSVKDVIAGINDFNNSFQ